MKAHLIKLYHQAEDYFFRGISQKCLELGDEATAYLTGVQAEHLNLVYLRKNTNAIDEILEKSKYFYDNEQLAFVVMIPEEFYVSSMENILNTMGYHQIDQSVTMVINLENMCFHNETNFDDEDNEIIIQANDNKLNDWMIPLVEAFESTIEISSQYMTAHENAMKKGAKFHHFSIYKQEKPIGSITLSLHNDIARIDDVGILPEFQGQGYGTNLMLYALLKAQQLGAIDCFLEASKDGLSVYEKLGFKPLFKNNIYSKEKL